MTSLQGIFVDDGVRQKLVLAASLRVSMVHTLEHLLDQQIRRCWSCATSSIIYLPDAVQPSFARGREGFSLSSARPVMLRHRRRAL